MISTSLKLGDDVFVFGTLGATRTFVLQPLIAPVVAEVLGVYKNLDQFAGAKTVGEIDLGDIDLDALLPIFNRVCAKLSPEVLEEIKDRLLFAVTVENKPLVDQPGGDRGCFDARLSGRHLDMWKLLVHAVRVYYADFFALLGARGSAQQAASPSEASAT